jgi:hypothetical protein
MQSLFPHGFASFVRVLRQSGYSMDRARGHRASVCNFVQDLRAPHA